MPDQWNSIDNTRQGEDVSLGCFQGFCKVHVSATFRVYGEPLLGSLVYLGTHAFVCGKFSCKDLWVAAAKVEGLGGRQIPVTHGREKDQFPTKLLEKPEVFLVVEAEGLVPCYGKAPWGCFEQGRGCRCCLFLYVRTLCCRLLQ